MPRTVLLLHHGRDWIRGSERCLLDLATHLDRERFTTVLMCNAPTLANAARALNLEVVQSSGWDEAGTSLRPRAERVAEIAAVVDRFDVRLMHANNLLPIKSALGVARRRGIPVVAQLHLQTTLDERLYTGLHQVDAIVGVSEAVATPVRRDGVPASRIRVIHNGVDPRRLDTGDASGFRQQYGIPEKAFLFVAVTSLIPLKAVDVMLRAMAGTVDAQDSPHLAILGSGPAGHELRVLAEALRLADRVHFCGERGDVGAILRQAADAVVTASRVEAFPLNVLEAGYCACPVVASDIPPHREAIVHGRTGLIVPVDDVAALADAMSALAHNRAVAAEMGRQAEALVLERYLLRENVRRFQELYDELMSRPAWTLRWPGGAKLPSAYLGWVARAIRRRLRSD